MTVPIKVDDAISCGWDTLQKHFAFLVSVHVAVAVVSTLFSMLYGIAEERHAFLEFLVWFASLAVGGLLEMGVILIALKLVDNGHPQFSDLFLNVELLTSYVVAVLLYGSMIVVGLFLLIVPGIYVAIRFQFFAYSIVDEGTGAIDSLRRSARLTEGRVLSLFLLDLLLVALNILGALFFGVGLLITLPIGAVALAYTFRWMQRQEVGLEPSPPDGKSPESAVGGSDNLD